MNENRNPDLNFLEDYNENLVFMQILEILNINNIIYESNEHEKVRTSEDAAKINNVDIKVGAKSMILKAQNNYYLFVLSAGKKINWNKIKSILGKKNVRLATESEAENFVHIKMGGIPPFGNVLGLQTYFDVSILEQEYISFNPGIPTRSILMRSIDLKTLVNPIIEEFGSE